MKFSDPLVIHLGKGLVRSSGYNKDEQQRGGREKKQRGKRGA